MLVFLGLLCIAIAIFGSAFFLSKRILTVRVSQGYLVPKEMISKKESSEPTTEKEKRPSRRARDLVSP